MKRERRVFLTNDAQTTVYLYIENKVGHLPWYYTKKKVKMDQELNLRIKITKEKPGRKHKGKSL